MSFAPQQDWALFAFQSAAENAAWIRSLSVNERFAIYADMFRLVWQTRRDLALGDWEELDRWNWRQKLSLRERCVAAYQRLDDFRNARATATDTD